LRAVTGVQERSAMLLMKHFLRSGRDPPHTWKVFR
jgi:hypothetical protein